MAEEFKFEIKEHIEDLTEKSEKGWIRQLNIVSWNNGADKYDIRDWHVGEDGKPDRCGKGITMTYEEVALLGQALYDKGIC